MTPEELAQKMGTSGAHITLSEWREIAAHLRRLAALEDENKRLREALEWITTVREDWAADIAREALGAVSDLVCKLPQPSPVVTRSVRFNWKGRE